MTSRPRLGAAVVPLLAACVFINYVDRGNLSTAGSSVQGELSLTSTQLGTLLSAFFWTYVPGQIVAAWLAERVGPYRVLSMGVAAWGIATATTGLAGTFAGLLALRLLLGIGEAAVFPCISKLLARHVPPEELGAANGQVNIGLGLGPAFGTFVGGMLIARYGWRSSFLVVGLASLLWLLPWWTTTPAGAERLAAHDAERAPSFLVIMGRRELWGACLGQFCGNYGFYFVITWMPTYLVRTHGFSLARMATLGGAVYLAYAASTVLTGWVTDRLARAGFGLSGVRRATMGASYVVASVAMIAAAVGNANLAIAALFVAGAGLGLSAPTLYAIGQTLAGPRAAGKWMGVQNSVANLAGVVAPIVTGVIVDRTGEFSWAFVAAGAFLALALVGWLGLIPRVAPLDWEGRAGLRMP